MRRVSMLSVPSCVLCSPKRDPAVREGECGLVGGRLWLAGSAVPARRRGQSVDAQADRRRLPLGRQGLTLASNVDRSSAEKEPMFPV
jgi:hypothetical protein